MAALRIYVILLAADALLPAQSKSPNAFVDSRLCASCHSQIAKDYQQTGMGRSFFRPASANTVEDYTKNNKFDHAQSETHYTMIARDGAYYQRRWQVGFGGKETNVEELRIDYVLGSGNHARSYLHRTPRHTLIELPLGWYAENGGTWGMSPGFDSKRPATRRLISYECAFCHNGYPQIPAGHDAPGSEPVFRGALPEGIDCQRCHGAGGNHVRAAQSTGVSKEQIRAAVVNPARLSPKLRTDLCMQCHLEPASTAIPAIVRRFNRGPFSFTPGEPLDAFLLSFDHAPSPQYADKFEIVGSSAYRLRKSRCFIESKDALTCDTCHKAHRTARSEQYSAFCRQCHAGTIDALIASSKHPSGKDCVPCHMPKRRTDDVVHVVMTDHWIQRQPPQRDLLAPLTERHPAESEEYRGEIVPYYPPVLPEVLYRALAQVVMKNNLQSGVIELARLLTAQPQKEPEWYMQVGEAWLASNEPSKAVAAFEQALRLKPQSARALQSLAKALRISGEVQRSADLLKQALQVAPSDAASWYQSGVLASQMGRSSDALEKLQKAIALNPDLPGVYTTLAGIQPPAESEATLREALRIDPYDAAAWDLAGRVQAGKREFPEALFNFQRAIFYRPNFAPYLYDYALTLSTSGSLEQAQESVEAAIAAGPKLAEAHALLGGLLARKRQLPQAAKEYEEALELRPDFGRARLDLASVLAAQGDISKAIDQLREAAKSKDPQIARLAAAALERIAARK